MERRRANPTLFESAKLSIIVPVFNEAPQIVQNLNFLIAEVEASFKNFEIIVVSDGSTDETANKILNFSHPGFKPVVIERNSGKGNAVRAGFQQASGEYVLFIDGGMEIHPKEIRVFMGLMDLYECDIVVGSKRHPQSRVKYPWYRRMLSWMFQAFVRYLFQIDVTDTQVGIKLFRGDIIRSILPHLEINRYGFDLELLSLAKLAGYNRILEAPVRLDYFAASDRPVASDLIHVLKVGISLLKDTFALHFRLHKIGKIEKVERKNHLRRVG